MIHVRLTWEKDGEFVLEEEGYMDTDPFKDMVLMNRASQDKSATVSQTVSRSVSYGEVKCSCTITIHCPQDAQWIDRAAKTAFQYAVHYVNLGFNYLAPGLPPLNAPR